MDKRETINKNRYIISIFSLTIFNLILVYDLKLVVMYIDFVNKVDILDCTIITGQQLNIILLNYCTLLYYPIILVCNLSGKEVLPFIFCECIIIQTFELSSKINN
ncbi:hypothetical protein SDC9_89225 [bioreactor metagenome]|uniref:Uncharacterized protein n=1 Tax=bioreactor metagenome TaxID=1076179 RepID=A0A644ZNM8_9ZZZZ